MADKIPVSDFIDFVKSKIGCYYWYGTIGQTASESLYKDRKAAYPNYYTASDFKDQIANPKQCFDCAGLVKSKFVYPNYNSADDLGATGIYGKCVNKGQIKSVNDLKPGYLLFKGNDKQKSHVGVYIGDNTIIEAKGHAYGVIDSAINDTWKYWAEYYNVDYSTNADVKPNITGLSFDSDICKYCQGITLTVNTNTDPLRLRAGAGLNFPTITLMPKGAKVIYKGYYSGDWLQVTYNGYKGFACKDYLKK